MNCQLMRANSRSSHWTISYKLDENNWPKISIFGPCVACNLKSEPKLIYKTDKKLI